MAKTVLLSWLAVCAIGLAMFGAERPASALPAWTWTGNGASNLWSDAANWNPGVPPPGATLEFPVTANRKTNVNNLAANTAFDTITFNGSGYDISGNAVSLTTRLTNQSNGDNRLSLAIGGAGAIYQQTGRLILTGNNSFSGAVTVVAGALRAANNSALGDTTGETIVNDPGTLEISGSVDLGAEIINAAGEGFDGEGAVQSLPGTNTVGTLKIAGPTRVGVFNSTLIVDVLSQLASGGPLELNGGGKLQVEQSFFAGGVTVANGNLTWNASSLAFVDVEPHGILRGTGLVAQADVSGGMVWPGSGTAVGTLSVFNATTFSAGVFRTRLDGPAGSGMFGQLATNGLSLNPLATLLDLDVNTAPSTGDVYRIIDNTGGSAVQGTFFDLPEGATFVASGYVWRISYAGGTGNDVTLTVLRLASADLRLQLSALPSPVASGALITYTVVVSNDGPDTANSPDMSMGSPVGTTFVSSNRPSNWTCAKPSPGPSVRCTGPKMLPGEFVTITLTFRVDAAGGSLSGTAGVSSTTADPSSANNAVTISTPIGAADPRPFKRIVPGVARD